MNGPLGLPGFPAGLAPFMPGGYLTLVSGTPLAVSDQSAKTIIYYTQDVHNAFPVLKNGTRHAVYFDEPRLVLSAAHLASSIFDIFGVERSGRGHLVTGPAWATVTAGAGARGVTGSSTELARMGGMLVNRWGIPGLNGDGSQFVQPYEGTYLGSIFMDGTNGQISCLPAYGQSRKWGVWNAWNRKLITLKAGDATASWNYTTNTIRASRADSTNNLTVFAGLPDEYCDLIFAQNVRVATTGGTDIVSGYTGIGINSTTVMTGRRGRILGQAASGALNTEATCVAQYLQAPAIGINVVQSLETAPNVAGTAAWSGGEDDMVLSARWRG